MTLSDYLTGKISYEKYMEAMEAEVGSRVLVADRREGRWISGYSSKRKEAIYSTGVYWTVIDRETEEEIGSFGMPVQLATRDEALAEAERFGSKWDWPTDREWRRDGIQT